MKNYRHICVICDRRRYEKYMNRVPILKSDIKYHWIVKKWICKECTKDYLEKLSSLEDIIKHLKNSVNSS